MASERSDCNWLSESLSNSRARSATVCSCSQLPERALAALASHGALRILAAADRTEFGKLRAGLGAQPGFLHVAIRLLADQGWVTCAGEGGTDELTITPTPGGRVVMTRLAGAYAEAARFLILAGRVGADPVAADAALGPFLEAVRGDWGLPVTAAPADVRHQVLAHLNGHLIAPVMFGLMQANRPPAGNAAQILARLGWVRRDGGADRLTAAGEMAMVLARQHRYPMVYLPLLRSVPGLIFGDLPAALPVAGAVGDDETHLDRDLDIRFSGEVFAATCGRRSLTSPCRCSTASPRPNSPPWSWTPAAATAPCWRRCTARSATGPGAAAG